jgi:hypothetical protein
MEDMRDDRPPILAIPSPDKNALPTPTHQVQCSYYTKDRNKYNMKLSLVCI